MQMFWIRFDKSMSFNVSEENKNGTLKWNSFALI